MDKMSLEKQHLYRRKKIWRYISVIGIGGPIVGFFISMVVAVFSNVFPSTPFTLLSLTFWGVMGSIATHSLFLSPDDPNPKMNSLLKTLRKQLWRNVFFTTTIVATLISLPLALYTSTFFLLTFTIIVFILFIACTLIQNFVYLKKYPWAYKTTDNEASIVNTSDHQFSNIQHHGLRENWATDPTDPTSVTNPKSPSYPLNIISRYGNFDPTFDAMPNKATNIEPTHFSDNQLASLFDDQTSATSQSIYDSNH